MIFVMPVTDRNRRAARRYFGMACLTSVLALAAACSSHHATPQGGYQDAAEAVAHNDYRTADAILKQVVQDNHKDNQVLFLAGKVALEQGDAQRAASLFEDLAQRDAQAKPPVYADRLRPLLARAQLALNNLPGALHTLGDAYMTDSESCAMEVRVLSQAGEFGRAIDVLDRGLKAFPQSSDLQVLDGLRAQALGQNERADAIAAQLLKAQPDNVEVLIFAGRLAIAEQRMADAKRIFGHVHDLRPEHHGALLALASIAHDTGDNAAEKQWVDLARSKSASDPVAASFAAEMALAAGHADEADRMLAHIDDTGAENAPLRMLKGLINAQLGRRDIAIEQLSTYLSHGGQDGRARLALAVMLTRQGDKAKAWQALKPLADSANATLAPLQLASALAAASHDPAAATYAARAAALAHDDHHDLAAADDAIKAGDWHRADALYTQLLAGTRGNRVMLLNNAAYAKINLGQTKDAVLLARQASAMAPNDPIVLDTLGWALFKAGGAGDEVKNLLARAVSLQPGNATIRQHLVAVQASAG